MADAARVHVAHRRQHLAREALRRRLVERPRAPAVRRARRQKGPELAARAEVEDQVDPLLLVEDLVQPADVRVVQLARRRDLGVQPVPARAAPQPDGLARELAAVALPRAAPDDAVRAPPQQLVVHDVLVAHGARRARRRRGPVPQALVRRVDGRERQFHADVERAQHVEAALGAVPAARVELGQGVDAPEQRLRRPVARGRRLPRDGPQVGVARVVERALDDAVLEERRVRLRRAPRVGELRRRRAF